MVEKIHWPKLPSSLSRGIAPRAACLARSIREDLVPGTSSFMDPDTSIRDSRLPFLRFCE